MDEPPRDYRKRYEELMRGAGEHRRRAAKRELEYALRRRDAKNRRRLRNAPQPHALLHVVAVLDAEVLKLHAKLANTRDQEERVLIKAEIAHFEAVMQSLRTDRRPRAGSFDEGNRRKPDPVTNSRVQRVLSALDGPHRAILLSILEATKPKRRRPPEAGFLSPLCHREDHCQSRAGQKHRSISRTTELGQSFEYAVHLDCDPDLVWAQVLRPALFLHVAAPLVRFRPIGIERFPEQWSEGEYRCAMRLFGILPFGWQAIVIELPEAQGDTRTLFDNGYSPMLPRWNHRISVRPENGGTRYTDSVSFDAGFLTPITGVFIKLFFRHRQRRFCALAADGFAAVSD